MTVGYIIELFYESKIIIFVFEITILVIMRFNNFF